MAGANWTDPEDDDRPRREASLEERVDERRGLKRLADCRLPEGFRLESERPKQYVIDGLMLYGFVLSYHVPGKARCYHLQRYEATVNDEVQMQWALEDFTRELRDAGYEPETRVTPSHTQTYAGRLRAPARMPGVHTGTRYLQ